MYRDLAPELDEHDRAVGAILIGQVLLEECDRAAARIRDEASTTPHDRWRALTDVQDTYPEIWRHLDRARRELAARGANTAGYDELRPHTRRAPTAAEPSDADAIDPTALDQVKRALEELKLAVPGTNWDAIEARTRGLVAAPLSHRRRNPYTIAALVVLIALAGLGWMLASVPPRPSTARERLRSELAQIQQHRRIELGVLRAELGTSCTPSLAHELVRQLVLDGQVDSARAFGRAYVARCGEDSVVDHWAHAPPPGH